MADLPTETFDRFAREVADQLREIPGVNWARFNACLERVVVDHDPERLEVRALVRAILALEHEMIGRACPLKPSREPGPGDPGPMHRLLVEMGGDAFGLVLGAWLRFTGVRVLRVELALEIFRSVLDYAPPLHALLDRRLGRTAAELLLSLMRSLDQGLIQGLAPVVDLTLDAMRLSERRARRAVWSRRERDLCGRPEQNPPRVVDVGRRPFPFPSGTAERYEQRAVPAAVSGFLFELLRGHTFERAAALIFGGVPRPTRVGRDAFAAHLGLRLAKRDVLVLDGHALTRLDRIDAIVFAPPRSAQDAPVLLARLCAEIRAANLRLVMACDDHAPTARFAHESVSADPHGIRMCIRRLQRAGRAVAFFGTGPEAVFRAADLSVRIVDGEDEGDRWGAQVICANGLTDLRLLIACIVASRGASGQSVATALAEAVAAVTLLLGNLAPATPRRIMDLATLAALVSMLNGVRLAQRATTEPAAVPSSAETPWHALDLETVFTRLASSPRGLEPEEAVRRRPPPAPIASSARRLVDLVAEELQNPLTPILAVGAGLSLLLGSVVDSALISGVVAANALMGALQRLSVGDTLEALDRRIPRLVRVRRGSSLARVPDAHVVVGDVITLDAGEIVPADCRVVCGRQVEVDESALTGESLPVIKNADPVDAPDVAERTSMLYAGTTIASGTVEGVVVATGRDTEARRVLFDAAPRALSGVEERLGEITRLTVPIALASGLGISVLSALRGSSARDVITAGVSLTVSAVPEGLPILATLAQLAAARRLSKQGAIARNPHALEALGRVNVLCVDKTGTLTEGRLQLRSIHDGFESQRIDALDDFGREVLASAIRASPASGRFPSHRTDQVLLEAARSLGVVADLDFLGWRRKAELAFETRRAFHATLGATLDGGERLSVKGAPEEVLRRSAMHLNRARAPNALLARDRARLMAVASSLAERGYRVLAAAERRGRPGERLSLERVDDLCFLGFLCIADRIRDTARSAIDALRKAGIAVVMLTGDHPATARTIAEALGLSTRDHRGVVLTGHALDALDDIALRASLARTVVVARVTPEHKARVVRCLQGAGKVVAMAGDGANDAPAILLADVGIALAGAETEAASRAADVVITDARLETAVRAILEGRALWISLREALGILVGGNLGEIVFLTVGTLLSGRPALTTRQLLLLNLLTDAFPATAIAARHPPSVSPEQLLREGPEVSLGAALTRQILWRGTTTSAASLLAGLAARGGASDPRSVSLLVITGAQLAQTLIAARGDRLVLGTALGSIAGLLAAVQIPRLSRFFGSDPVTFGGLAQAAAASIAAAWVSTALVDRAVADRREASPTRGATLTP